MQFFLNPNAVKQSIFRTLLDQSIQDWYSKLESSSKGKNYRLYKTGIAIENYLINFPVNIYLPILKFRITNHRLPVELGRWVRKPYEERRCLKCNSNSVGDEFHYLLECDLFKEDRHRLVEKYFFTRPNSIKFSQLLNSNQSCVIKKLSVFMNIIIRHFENE